MKKLKILLATVGIGFAFVNAYAQSATSCEYSGETFCGSVGCNNGAGARGYHGYLCYYPDGTTRYKSVQTCCT